MTLTIELAPGLDERLREEAERRGLAADELARRLIEGGLPPRPAASRLARRPLTLREELREIDAFGSSVDPSVPPLPDEAVSRESFYGERDVVQGAMAQRSVGAGGRP